MSSENRLADYQTHDGVAVVTLTNPPANAYSYAMMRQLDNCILEARANDDVHVIMITGDGGKFFCAGADIAMLQKLSPTAKYSFCLHANETLQRLEQTPKLVIAALNGHTVGGGLEIALACDLRVARRGAGKIGLPEVHLGVLPGTGGTQRLVRLVGKSRAMHMMVEGRNFTFEQAQNLGLVNMIIGGDEISDFQEQALNYARSFCPPGRASRAVGLIKRACQTGSEASLDVGLALERELQQQLFMSQDSTEGISAYNDKRTPEFTGK
jgi:enoyl-CoA hydratase